MGFVGRDKASARQSEQLEPDLILGMAQNLADRRLQDIQAARRGADRTADIYGMKDLDLPDAHSQYSFFGLGRGCLGLPRGCYAIQAIASISTYPAPRLEPTEIGRAHL